MEDDKIKKLIETTQKKIKNIKTTEKETMIEFEDGEVLNLSGGQSLLGAIKQIPVCSYCGKQRSKQNPMISPDNNETIMICSDCTVKALETFIKSGVEIELDISFLNK
jgi:NADH pyrophosphatase NudC (nudix superfamily)